MVKTMKNVSNDSEPELDPRGKSDLHLSPSAAVSLNAMKETHGPSLEKSSFPPTLRPSSIGLLRSNQSSSFETNVRKARAGIRICNRFRQTRNSRGTNAVRDRLDTTGRSPTGIGREPSDSRRSSSTIPLLVIFGLVIYAGFFSARGDWHSRPIKNLEPIKTVPFAFKEKLNEQLSDLTLVVPEKHADRHDSSTASTCNYTDTFVEEDKPIAPKFRILMAMATLELFPVLLSHVDSLRLELGSAMNQLLPIPLIPCNDETSSPVDADTEELERIACETNGFWSRASQLRDEVMEILKNKTSIMNELETGDRLLNRVQRKQVAADAAEGCRRLMVENMAKNPFAEFNSAVLAMKNGTSNNPRVFDLARTRQDLLRLIWDGYNTRRNVFVGTKFEKLAESIPESANIVAMMQDEIDLMLQASKRVFRAGLNSQIMLDRVLAQDQEFAEVLGKIDRLLAHRSTLNVLEDNLLKVKIAADRIGEPLGYNMALDTGKTQENSGYNVDSDQGGDCSLRNDQNEEEEEEDHHQKMTRDDCAELLRRKMGDICLPDCDRVQKEDQLIMIQRKIEILQKLNACVKDDFEQLGKYRLAYKNFKTMELGVQKKLLTSIGGIAHLLPMVRPDLQALNDDLENARREIEEQRTILSRMKVVQNKIIRESVIAANQLLTILNIADFPRDGLLTFRVNEVIHKVDQVEADIYCLKLLLESEEAPIECAAIIKRLVKEKTWPRDIPGNFTCSGLNNKNPLNPRKKKKVPKTSTVIVSEDKPNFKCLLSDSVTETRDETDDPFVPRKNNNEPDADNDHHANAFRQIFGNAKRLSDEFPANIGVKYSGDSRANLFPENPPLMVDEGGPSFQSKKAKTRETQVVEEISASCADQVCHTSKATASNNIHRPLSIFKTLKNDAKFWATGDGSTSRRFKAKKTDALPSLLGLESDFASHGVPSNKDEFVHNLDDADVSPRCGKQDHQDEDPCVDGTDEKCIALRRRQRYEFGADGRAKVDPPKPLPPRESVQIPPASDIPR
ncbi:unnamed protein product [Notodromas monacha]|uniref:Uncharacterized protein n=1 Tax=Notodromas monacha TaxID=399045 RepID=A0A7R9BM54_9CRUS|nr:unnamed protein product [Notodromas monacha]CAG0918044.1 unnamed protein product [Notodromas monacha]